MNPITESPLRDGGRRIIRFLILFALLNQGLIHIAIAQWTTVPFTPGRIGLAGTAAGGKAIFAGGVSSVYFDNVNIYDQSTGTWTNTAKISQARFGLAAASVGTKAFFAGGEAVDTPESNVVDIYDATSNTWTVMSLSQARHDLAAAANGSKVFFAGGSALGLYSDVVDIFDVNTNTWQVAHLSEARGSMVGASVGTKVIFAGGTRGTLSAKVDIFDISTGAWTTATLSVARSNIAAATVGTKVFFGGGTKVVDVYDNANGSWTTLELSAPRELLSSAANGNKVYFAGGSSQTSTGAGITSNVLDIYDVATATWTTSAMPGTRTRFALVLLGTELIFAGGASGTYATTAYIYDASFFTAPTVTDAQPRQGPPNTSVTIMGTDFANSPAGNIVKFNGTTASITGTPTATSLVAVVPGGATTGKITVQAGSKTATSSFDFVVQAPDVTAPTVLALAPADNSTNVPVNTNLVITFSEVVQKGAGDILIKENGIVKQAIPVAASAVVVDGSTVTIDPADFDLNALLNVEIQTGAFKDIANNLYSGISNATSWNFGIVALALTSVTPTSGPVGSTVTITGTGFSSLAVVKFGGVTALVISATATTLTVTVPAAASTGAISVTIDATTVSGNTFTVTTAAGPVITGFTPVTGIPGTSVTISGSNFGASASGSEVAFNGAAANVTSGNSTSVTAIVPAGAATGRISVKVNGVTATSPQNFVVMQSSTVISGLLKDITVGPTSSTRNYMDKWVPFKGHLYFVANNLKQLWRTDGTSAGTAKIADNVYTSANLYGERVNLVASAESLYYFEQIGTNAPALIALDGNLARNVVTPGVEPMFSMAPVGGKLLFSNIWASDQDPFLRAFDEVTKTVTTVTLAIWPKAWHTHQGQVFLWSHNLNANTRGFYSSDGTAAGTKLLYGGVNTPSSPFASAGEYVYAQAALLPPGPADFNLLRMDASAGSGVKIEGLSMSPGYNIGAFADLGGKLMFIALNKLSNGVYGLYKVEGTAAVLVKTLTTDPTFVTAALIYNRAKVLNGFYYFRHPQRRYELWRSDGTETGTGLFSTDVTNQKQIGDHFEVIGDKLFYTRWDHSELWVTDGTASGTRKINTTSNYFFDLTSFNNLLFYHGSSAGTGAELFVFNPADLTACSLPKPTVATNGMTLTSNADSGNQWIKDGSDIAGATAKTFTATSPGAYAVRVTIDGCSATSDVVNLACTLAKPVVTFTNGTLASSSPTGNQWLLNGGSITGAIAQTYTPTVAGSYSVKVTSGSCSATSDAVVLVVTGLDGHEVVTSVFPNPTEGIINVHVSSHEGAATVDVYNLLGVRVGGAALIEMSGIQSGEVDLTHQPPGIYIITIRSDTGEQRHRVLRR